MLQVDVSFQRGAFQLRAQFDAPTPGVTALFGRSGCGKTTLINLVAGLLHPNEGSIRLGNEVWFDSARKQYVPAEQRRIGYVFQDARLFPHYSVKGNLLYGAGRKAQTGERAIGYDDIIDLLGLQHLLTRRPAQLSGGEKQRVALGRTLLSQPRLLLLDEPLASLDAARRNEILPYLEKLRDSLALPMLFVSHQFDDVLRIATHMVVMDAGVTQTSGDLYTVSHHPALLNIIGKDGAGTVIEGVVESIDSAQELASVRVSAGIMRVPARQLQIGAALRMRLLARDIILAISEPRGLSVRNQLRGTVISITPEAFGTLVEVNIGGNIRLLSRVSLAATQELQLRPGLEVWALAKAVSVSGHVLSHQP
jgi:molybdate transport system ATP-binding protein